MKQFLLALVLIAVPVGAFATFQLYYGASAAAVATSAALGDLSSLRDIVTYAQGIAASGDMVATEERMTDFETAWDAAEPKLRALDSAAWGNVDDAHDAVLDDLRGSNPIPAEVDGALSSLVAVLDDPSGGSGTAQGAETVIAGVTITDGTGRPLPCEEMLKSLKGEMAGSTSSDGNESEVREFLAKGTERCNADDDRRADEFLAQGFALLRK